ncbi:NTP transferase domain-containing protein [Ancylobacter amanitiformis]|uniref:Bifunctional UDP-N-acetylglucosamine pyrophosphorylase/glucosamine-1-phosphate N-acetyltransferase n=1 Tax=Ancylobacter amanitiformis TaxID=217069 RepID=A0ABU0LKE2_9HYPH|nr:NTP transferase domain-containing protein [Ancylobacter amanitiformis]MDQ0509167.1 bifunctional UDP-N-acetylglucosamine pyrophosphorylase/glucosamine-1-phosphate N-acetyltransferase [Ancylobacter amanitiformis]
MTARPTHAIAAIVLAAGKGSRMGSELHKVLHPLRGKPMLGHLLDSLAHIDAARIVLVVGAGREQIERAYPDTPKVVQREQRGTADAVRTAEAELGDFPGTVLILYGDVPLIAPATMRTLCAAVAGDAVLAVLGFRPGDTRAYGRLVTAPDGGLARIVEHADASEEERRIDLCNSGVMAVRGEVLFPLLARVGCANAKGEYYLTDIVALARGDGHRVAIVEAAELEVSGVNSREELAALEARLADAAS